MSNLSIEINEALNQMSRRLDVDRKYLASVVLSTGHTLTVDLVRRRMGYTSRWWGMKLPSGETVLGGLDKATVRTKAHQKIKAALEVKA